MQSKRDFWLSLTVISCFVAIFALPACVLSFVAAARWEREPVDPAQPRRIRIDLRVPTSLIGLGSATLAWCCYRRYVRYLRDPE